MKRLFLSTLLFFSLPTLSAKYYGFPHETRPRYAIDAIAEELATKHQLKFLNSGGPRLLDAQQSIWTLSFTSQKTLTLDEARAFTGALLFPVLEKLFHNPVFEACCKRSSHLYPEVTEGLIGLKLAFWDKEMHRPTKPYISQVRLVDGKLYYYYADSKTHALEEPIIETIEDLHLPNYRS